tara:strand:- start:778 stop:1209 length:432 start_codon:yes stop_codon:yes gene_type:complete
MDPASLFLAATTGYKLLQKGFGAGREITQMSRELGSVLDYISGVEEAQKSNKKSNPLNDYLEYERAKTLKKDLENLIFDMKGSRGVAVYKSFVAKAEQTQREGRYEALARKNKILNVLSILLGMAITLGGGAVLVWAAIEFKP